MRFRSAVIAILLLTSSTALAAPKAKKHAPAPAKKKATASAPAVTKQLTAASLGLEEIPLASPPPPPAPAPAPEPAPILVPQNKDKVLEPGSDAPRRFSVELNPLAIGAGRYGINIEYALARHHVITGSGFYQAFPSYLLGVIMAKAIDTSHGAAGRPGGELGYRFYTGQRGANGFFVGASGVAMPLPLPHVTPDYKGDVVTVMGFGGALDVGIQAITDSGFTIGGGLGAMYLAYDTPNLPNAPAGVAPVKLYAPHFLPRALLSAGWSF